MKTEELLSRARKQELDEQAKREVTFTEILSKQIFEQSSTGSEYKVVKCVALNENGRHVTFAHRIGRDFLEMFENNIDGIDPLLLEMSGDVMRTMYGVQ